MSISRDNFHKKRATGGTRKSLRKKRKFDLGRPAANTKFGTARIHNVKVRAGNIKYRTLRLDSGNFAWAFEGCARKTRVIDVVSNASNNELVRTKTLMKNAIVVIDATPFRQWYESHYILPLVRKRDPKHTQKEDEIDVLNKKRTERVMKKYLARQKYAEVEQRLEKQFSSGRLLVSVSFRPGQCGRADGYIIECKELEFYMRKIKFKSKI